MAAATKQKAPPKTRSGRPLLDFGGASAYLGLKENFLRRLTAESRIPHIKMTPGRTGRIYFDPDELDAWITASNRSPES